MGFVSLVYFCSAISRLFLSSNLETQLSWPSGEKYLCFSCNKYSLSVYCAPDTVLARTMSGKLTMALGLWCQYIEGAWTGTVRVWHGSGTMVPVYSGTHDQALYILTDGQSFSLLYTVGGDWRL